MSKSTKYGKRFVNRNTTSEIRNNDSTLWTTGEAVSTYLGRACSGGINKLESKGKQQNW